MEYMTKTEFAERIDVSKVTVFNWIKSDKNGIRRYTSSQGISTDIFTDPAWSNLDTKEGALTRAAQLRRELEKAKQEAAGYKIDLDAMTRRVDELRKDYESKIQNYKADCELYEGITDGLKKEVASIREQVIEHAEQRQRDKADLESAVADRDELKKRLVAVEDERDKAMHTVDVLRAEVDGLKARVDGLEADKAYLQGQYNQQAEMLARLMLPAPRRTFGQAVRNLFGIKSGNE